MFRLSTFVRELVRPTPAAGRRDPPAPVVIWNLVRRCNLACLHCYSTSADVDFAGELSTAEVFAVMDDLRRFGVPALVLSGGEPLLRPDLFAIASRAKALGFYTALSTNGTRIDEPTADRIAATGFDYVGVSLDGLRETHDRFRRRPGAFDASLEGLRRCRARGVKVGLRCTLGVHNAHELAALLALAADEGVHRFYLSHFNYAGRGNRNRAADAGFRATRAAMDLLFETAWRYETQGRAHEFATGNNDADGVYFLLWVRRHFPQREAHIHAKLLEWGGNATGVGVANIDNLGDVHPDTFWWDYRIGNVRERPFSEIWKDPRDRLVAALRARPRPLGGRCGACAWVAICNGNTRVRARAITGDPWEEDPGCYLEDAEIGVAPGAARVPRTPWRGRKAVWTRCG
jgi:heme d1 biosynthesis radical SAM protein NirJ